MPSDAAPGELVRNAQQEEMQIPSRIDIPSLPVLRVDLVEEIEDRVELLRQIIEAMRGWCCSVVGQQGTR